MYLSFDVGGTSIKAAVFDDNLILKKKYYIPYYDIVYTNDFPDFLIENLIKTYNSAIEEFPTISSIACGVPGVVSSDNVIIVAPNMTGIINFPIKKIICEQINLPFIVQNDANVAALAELHIGNGQNLDYFVYVTLGTGIGGAIIYEGKLLNGSSGGAGEIGHIIIDYNNSNYDVRDYRKGTIEVLSGRLGILNLAKEILTHFPYSSLNNINEYDVKDISILAQNGDLACRKILEITGNRIGVALVNIANILDIPNFIIGGGISKSSILLENIQKTLVEKSLPSIKNRVNVIPAKFLEDTGIYGAAVLAKYYS